MNISNESTSKLPNELQKAVENAKNVLTITEQETKRLNILAKDQESIIRGLLDRKAAAEDDTKQTESILNDVKADLKRLQEEVSEKSSILKGLNADISSANTMLSGINEAKDRVRDILKSLE